MLPFRGFGRRCASSLAARRIVAGDLPASAAIIGPIHLKVKSFALRSWRGVGALFVILSNGGYAVMDRRAERQGSAAPWPRFDIDVAAISRAFGSDAQRFAAAGELEDALDEALPELGRREEPLLLDVAVAPDEVFEP
jgi:benzoylformate decarboxylase